MSEPHQASQDRLWAVVGGHVLLVAHAIARHKLLFVLTWVAVVALSLALLAGLSKSWSVQTTIQVTPTQVISDLSGAAKPAPGTRSSASGEYALETVLSRENLIELIRETDLMEQWPRIRAPIPKLKDLIWARVFRPPTPEDRLDGFVTLLEKGFWVTSDQTTITIGIVFPDPELALKLVEGAQAKFLEAREVQEISTVQDGIGILEKRVSEGREVLDQSLKKLEDARKVRATQAGRRPSRPVATGTSLDMPPSRRGSQLVQQVESKQRSLAALVEERQRRIAELQTRLEQLRSVYSETHPAVVETRESLEALRRDSPQIAALQQEIGPLEAELQQRGLLSDVPLKAQRDRSSALDATTIDLLDPLEDQDPAITYAKAEMLHAYARYNALRDRLQAAGLELDSARAAFKYRYMVIRPAQRPRAPASPKRSLVAIASVLAGLVLAAFAPAFVDLSSRMFVEDWQVEQALGVPLLGKLPEL
jgi:uncharacterized protein involved in exopolysaccharide biosynthesis